MRVCLSPEHLIGGRRLTTVAVECRSIARISPELRCFFTFLSHSFCATRKYHRTLRLLKNVLWATDAIFVRVNIKCDFAVIRRPTTLPSDVIHFVPRNLMGRFFLYQDTAFD